MKVGILGLPNVGKSTLFNALTRSRLAEAKNYPFCTIEPNVGMVKVPDERLSVLQRMFHSEKIIPAAIEFVDIAGLVQGASSGAGLGNQFLANIREVDLVVHVIRCFVDKDVIHAMETVDARRDLEVIQTELLLADLQSVQRQLEKNRQRAKSLDKNSLFLCKFLEKLEKNLNDGFPVDALEIDEKEAEALKSLGLLTAKPVIYACNMAEGDLADPLKNFQLQNVLESLKSVKNGDYCVICAQLEEELGEMSEEEEKLFLQDLGLSGSGVDVLIRKSYELLGLASFFTAGEPEARAWTFRQGMKAPQCAGVIHSDFERGFIKAEVVSYDDLVRFGGSLQAKQNGRYRLEGKDYEFQDGDVAIFRFSK